MSPDDEFPESAAVVLSAERERAVEELGRQAGQTLRRAAPADGAARAMRSAGRRQHVRVLAAGAVIALALVAGLIVRTAGNKNERRPVTTVTQPLPGAGALSDGQVARTILLTAGEYAPGWVEATDDFTRPRMLRSIAERVPACSPMLDTAFESDQRPAATDYQYFKSLKHPEILGEYAVVFEAEAAAQTMFDAVTDPGFLDGCITGYVALLRPDLDPRFPISPATANGPVDEGFGGDQTAMRTFQTTWTDSFGAVHGPVEVRSATIRVGRAVVIIETLGEDEFGRPVVSESQFRQAVEHVATRAGAALAGSDNPTVGTVTPAVAPPTIAVIAAPADSSPLTVAPVPGHQISTSALSNSGRLAFETADGGSGGSHLTIIDVGSAKVVDELDIDVPAGALHYSADTDLYVGGLGVLGRRGLVALDAPSISLATFSADGGRIAAATHAANTSADEHGLAIFDAHSGGTLTSLVGHQEPITDVAFSSDGSKLASGDEGGVVHIWDAASGASLHEIRSSDASAISRVAFDVGGSRLLTTTASGAVQIWDTATGVPVVTLADPRSGRTALLIGDGTEVLTSEPDGGLMLWRTADGTLVRRFAAGAHGPLSLGSLSIDGTRVAASDGDGGVTVWDVTTGERLFRAPPPITNTPMLSADGHTLTTINGDTASIWKLP